MPDKVRIVQRKDDRFDDYLRDLVASRGYGHERIYAGVRAQEAADEIRRKLRAAGKHVGVSVRVFFEPCPTPGHCKAGSDCAFHVRYTAFKIDDARRYKARQQRRAS